MVEWLILERLSRQQHLLRSSVKMLFMRKIGIFILGIIISICVQFVGAMLTVILRIPDPALEILYSSIGVILSLLLAGYFFWKKNWILGIGLVVGIPGWWLFVLSWMTVTGSWL